MTTVFDLLTFPPTSKAFSALRSSITDDSLAGSASTSGARPSVSRTLTGSSDDGSASRRKTSRLDTDSDAASASSIRSVQNRNPNKPGTALGDGGAVVADAAEATSGGGGKGIGALNAVEQKPRNVVKIEIVTSGKGIGGKAATERDPHLDLVRRCISVLLAKDTYENVPATYEVIYRACQYVITVAGRGEDLYGSLKLELEKGLGKLASKLLQADADTGTAMDVDELPAESKAGQSAIRWLSKFVEACDWFENQIHLLKSLLTYLDQAYILGKNQLLSTRDLAYLLFTERIFEHVEIATRLRDGIAAWLTWERKYRLPHDARPQITKLISHLVVHKQYAIFENHYIDLTESFYSSESTECYEKMKNDSEAYFRHVRHRIEEEEQRAKDVLLMGSWALVRKTTENTLWDDRLEWVVTTVEPYMKEKNLDGLAAMFTLFSRISQVTLLCQCFKRYLEAGLFRTSRGQLTTVL
ncbi:hypothetical protein AX16_005173 [Volvariella volvacea WC 439]|nr:hypothetical protein AX16_005173 [Volvariella volvacea WC 439]